MCNCKNIMVGSYDNQVELPVPEHMSPLRDCLGEIKAVQKICVDRCLENEIKHLWSLGIITTGCCCGHNVLDPYIGVSFDCIVKMKELGYQVRFNNNRPNDEDSFIPKST